MDLLKQLWKWLRWQPPVVILRAVVVACLNYVPYAGPRRDLERPQHVPLFIGKSQIALLLILDGEQTLDPIRIMKGLFLFSMEMPEQLLPSYERYNFIPYSFGPYSYDIDRDLDRLVEQGYVKISKKADKSWNYYFLSAKGKREAQKLSSDMPPQAIAYLRKIRAFVLSVSFAKLLDTIYAKYPAFATKSRYKQLHYQESAMTLIIAIGCNNGIVMGSDSASSDPITGTKQPVKKIQQMGNNPIMFGGAGDVGLIQKIVEELNDKKISRSAKFKLSRRLIQGACLPDMRDARDNHIPQSATGYDVPPTAILLFGCIHNKSPYILEIEADGRDTVYDQNLGWFQAIGSGKALAQAIMRPHLHTERDLSLGKMLAYRILEDAIELSAMGLAKPIHLYTLTLQGKFTAVEDHELRRLQSQCELWHELEREVLEKLIAPSEHDESEIVLGPYTE